MTTENIYKTQEVNLLPLHMVRPRFKNNIENVLFYMAKEITSFSGVIDSESLDEIISGFPGNSHSSDKTLANWRTEISALFGLMQYEDGFGYYASSISKRLAEKEDLIEFFKNFAMKIQFPNGMLKAHVNKNLIERGVDFAPLSFLIDLLRILGDDDKRESYITKDELTYVVFDDLRFTTGLLSPINAKEIIKENRKNNVIYETHKFVKGVTKESKGDQTRTALDFLDYLELGNLLIKKSSKYFLNDIESDFLEYACKENGKFEKFRPFYKQKFALSQLNDVKNSWFDYVNRLDFSESATSLSKFIQTKTEDNVVSISLPDGKTEKMTTKEIGDMGESIVITHEKNKLERLGLGHNKHLVQFIPTHLAAGYDVKSMDEMDNQIFIEVKTTLSNHPLTQSRISLTKNEWNAAYTNKENYYVYRLIITNDTRKLLVMNNPVGLVQQNKIKLSAPKGVELIFKPDILKEVELLA
ncbi:TPA: DUF3883 domain-containing protein [Vibrio parahaemolyticus]|nr:DUF3883 domain-containing protein [Vibrio parahaemolyticus]HAV1348617.1 DUF3883 domain-containing protein [Vibrio parahaemolyticus]HBN6086953.1 DUF3883 domain-containing protein [Vibrio parahaemolyticus]HBN6195516.1 DUF3883 domain-containing protein [Vibrio parahaemolyticus]